MKLEGLSLRIFRVNVVTDGVGLATYFGAPVLKAGGASSTFGFRTTGSSGHGMYSGIPPMRHPTASRFMGFGGRNGDS
eukprot:CAMPEP_0114695784 /NCGR_PEP_ID=MMETSP0191-20121206/71781_1 /TAXON_ID=126664 /ORGANISM="Sorites sp." /LENGTH=77 /DNA_ID=CAMNT_0001992527 /DNA_START=128 /DNA_END=361 /DNA_ORIENTATION=+